jgi:uncharacterized OB-fold protein
MGRSVLSAVVVRPIWRRGAFAVEGPDEDAFTLAVEALETLRERPAFVDHPFGRVQIVGPAVPIGGAELGEALGDPNLEVRHTRGGAVALHAALATATGPPGAEGPEAVVAVDTAPRLGSSEAVEAHGAGAVAFGIGEGPGVAVGPHGERNHPAEHRPDANAWVRTVRRAAGAGTELKGALLVRAAAAPPVLLAFWTRALPEVAVIPEAPEPEPLGPAPHIGPALDLLHAARLVLPGPVRVLVRIRPDSTIYAGFSVDAPIDFVGSDGAGSPGLVRADSGGREGRSPEAISQGAYVPRPRYVENLASRWRLVAERCPGCQKQTFPARGVCRFCGRSEGLLPESLPRDGGRIEAVTTVRPGAQPTEFDPYVESAGGYDVVLARIAPGILGTFQVTDTPAGTTRRGGAIRTRLRRLYATEGEWRYGRKAIPELGD